MDNVYSGHWSTDCNRAKYITMDNKKVNSNDSAKSKPTTEQNGWLFEISYDVLLVLPQLLLTTARRIPDNLPTPMISHVF